MSDGLITCYTNKSCEDNDTDPVLDDPGARTTWTMGLTWICVFSVLSSFMSVLSALFGFAGIMAR